MSDRDLGKIRAARWEFTLNFALNVGLVSAKLTVPSLAPRVGALADRVAHEVLERHVVIATVAATPNDIADLVHD